jgi:hypothetical protein
MEDSGFSASPRKTRIKWFDRSISLPSLPSLLKPALSVCFVCSQDALLCLGVVRRRRELPVVSMPNQSNGVVKKVLV